MSRPHEGREKLTPYVKPETASEIRRRVGKKLNTLGKVIDAAIEKTKKQPKKDL